MARITRNEILHNSNYELSEGHLHASLQNFKDVLEVRNKANKVVLANDKSVKEALKAIDKLKGYQIDIITSEDIRAMQDHAMKEAADIFKKAQKKRDQEVQHLEETLKKTEEELQVIRQLRSTFERDSCLKVQRDSLQLDLRFSIRVLTPLGESASDVIQRAYWFIRYVVENKRILGEDSPKPKVHTYMRTFKSVQQILGKVLISKDTRVNVLQKESDVIMQIQCISMKELEERLTTFNGIHFQEAVTDLRKSLDIEDDYQRKYDVTACCSSQNLKTITKQLSNSGLLKGPSSSLRCESHDGTQCSWYCGQHGQFFCKSCKEKDHRSCFGLQKHRERRGHEKLKQLLKEEHVKTPKKGFEISVVCILPNGDVLIGSKETRSILKLDSSQYPVSRFILPSCSSGMCYIGNDRVAAICSNRLVFIDVTFRKVMLKTLLPTDCVESIASHGDLIYTYDRTSVYTCKTDGTGIRTLFSVSKKWPFSALSMTTSIAISDNGENIYIINQFKLHIISSDGDLLHTTERFSSWSIPVGICCLGDGLGIVCYNFGHIQQFYFNAVKDECVFGRIDQIGNSSNIVTPLCYDRKFSRLVVGCRERLYVYNIQ